MPHASRAVLAVVLSAAAASASALEAQVRSAGGQPLDVAGLEVAGYEDYRVPVGRTEDGVAIVRLEARVAAWHPWGTDAQGLRSHVFAVPGEPAAVPGPMIRVAAGTPVRVSIRNTFPDTLLVRGLVDRGSAPPGAGAVFGRPSSDKKSVTWSVSRLE
jgi:FtsP/CotA-like multicopper oxidase with cupredoxin domain